MFNNARVTDLMVRVAFLENKVRMLEGWLPLVKVHSSMPSYFGVLGEYSKLQLEDKVDKILEHLGLEYQEYCSEELPKLKKVEKAAK